jgi:pSer/pThr/pTyr-binding forkhead associated (FHA) protein
MARIHYTTPEGTTGEAELTSERISVGRADDNAIVIPDGSVSSHHGELVFTGDDWVFTDLGSTNGTKIQGERVEQVSLTQTPSFTLGSVDIVFLGDEAAASDSGDYSAASASYAPASTATSDGYGALPYNGSLRTGFGPKSKPKGNGAGALIALGVLALAACGAAVFLFSSMAA